MTSHPATERHIARTGMDEQSAAAQRPPPSGAPPGQELLVQDGKVEQGTVELTADGGETQSAEAAKVVLARAALVFGVPILIGAALFTVGFLRRPIERALSHFIIRVEDIQVSSGLPLAIMDILREVRADMKEMSMLTEVQRTNR